MKFSFVILLVAFASHATGFRVAAEVKQLNSKTHLGARKRLNLVLSAVEAKQASPKVGGGDATVAASTFNLAKSIIGAGVLSLPSGVAFFSDSPLALLPASAILAFMGLLAAYTFSLIGRACERHGAKTFKDAWSKSVDPNSAWMISGAITAKCFFASLAYSIIIGDSFTALAKTFDLPEIFCVRRNVILLMTTLVLFPLNSLKSLSALAPFSLLGLGGTLYTAIVMAIRYFDKSYAVGGKFYTALAATARPTFAKSFGGLNMKAFVLLSMLSTAFISHYSAPVFHRELKDNTLPRFNKVTTLAFGAAIAIFAFMMSTGFLTFGGATAGFVLNNYASNDGLITIARLAIGLSIVTGYPFTFFALREGILDLAKVTDMDKRSNAMRPLTVGLLGIVTALAVALRDVGFVVSVSGAGFGAALMFVVPAIMNICNIKSAAKETKGGVLAKGEKVEIAANYGIIGMGTALGILGVTISTLRQLKKL